MFGQGPNITGSFISVGTATSGAFSSSGDSPFMCQQSTATGIGFFSKTLSAESQSAIYTGAKLQSQALQVLSCIKF